MIFLTKFYRRYQRTNLRVLLLWLVLTQIFMFILYTHLVKFTASPNANKWIYMKGPRLPVQHRIVMKNRKNEKCSFEKIFSEFFKLDDYLS